MAKKDEQLVGNFFSKRWNASSLPAAGSTARAKVSIPHDANVRANLEFLWYSIKNGNSTGTASAAAQVKLTPGGTVIFSADHLVNASQTANVNMQNMGLVVKKGSGIVATFDTTVGSVSYKVNIAGWYNEDGN